MYTIAHRKMNWLRCTVALPVGRERLSSVQKPKKTREEADFHLITGEGNITCRITGGVMQY